MQDLNERQIELIRKSFATLRQAQAPADTTFYDLLFERRPDLRTLFRDDLAGQGMKFMSTLATIVDSLDVPDMLDPELTRLAEGHAAMGVRASYYAPLGDALFDTFRDIIGPEFDEETEDAWRVAYAGIAARMISA